MKKILLLLLATSYMLATSLLTYNIYDRSDRVDLMLSFDSPYNGQIYQEKLQDTITLKLSDLNYNKIIKKDINSEIIQKMMIVPNKDFLKIIIKSKNQIAVVASKTTDGFGLRIRVKNLNIQDKKITLSQNRSLDNNLNFTDQDENSLDTRYIIVVVILFVLLVLMFWIRKKIPPKDSSLTKKSWLFKITNTSNQDIKILHRKQIDAKNSVLLLEFENRKYLVMSGASNLLLDTFGDKELQNSGEFEKVFEDNRKKLDDFLKIQDDKLENYKEKASNDFQKDLEFYK